jgi:hypothetical protein
MKCSGPSKAARATICELAGSALGRIVCIDKAEFVWDLKPPLTILAPAVLAIVLGSLAELALRQSLFMSSGDFSIFFTRPIAGVIAIVVLLLPLYPVMKRCVAG